MNKAPEKSRVQVSAQGVSKKAKQPAKSPPVASPVASKTAPETKLQEKVEKPVAATPPAATGKPEDNDKTEDQIRAEREAKRLAKKAGKKKSEVPAGEASAAAQQSSSKKSQPAPPKPAQAQPKPDQQTKPVEQKSELKPSVKAESEITAKLVNLQIVDDPSAEKVKPVMTKAERRAIQEAQRAAKAKVLEDKEASAKKLAETLAKKVTKVIQPIAAPVKTTSSSTKNSNLHKVKLFKHLYSDNCDMNLNVNSKLHPAIVKLGLQYANNAVVGSNSRCYAFLNAMKIVS